MSYTQELYFLIAGFKNSFRKIDMKSHHCKDIYAFIEIKKIGVFIKMFE